MTFFFFCLLSFPCILIFPLSVLLLLQGGVVDFKEKELLLLKLNSTQEERRNTLSLKRLNVLFSVSFLAWVRFFVLL
jgi:hypothetical protein